ncbi:MAG: hypothetical protein KGL00_08030 [Gammaproteobacteria bacterium]|nr:hypothetical protein [Gammaproteobacteria bacterium]MDE1886504.1 hypothetical protein [Gammaproteobacteria bacterium]MDE2023622.1 hypothetical protein [Gammaproteobacteria bacterium]MDE2274134.1 hypothetical protein [Gammaproteobacteria bacterium]
MSTGWFIGAAVVAIIVTSLTDWFFGGVLFHEKYKNYPEIWRNSGKGECLAITWSVLLGVLTCVIFIYLAVRLDALSWGRALGLAFGIWLLAPLPLLVTNALFIKIHPVNTLSNVTGWLVKLFICAAAAHLFLG